MTNEKTALEYAWRRADCICRLLECVDATAEEIEEKLLLETRNVPPQYRMAREVHWLERQCELVMC